MKNQGTIEEFIDRLKTRYSRDNIVLDLLRVIEMLREENLAVWPARDDTRPDERKKD